MSPDTDPGKAQSPVGARQTAPIRPRGRVGWLLLALVAASLTVGLPQAVADEHRPDKGAAAAAAARGGTRSVCAHGCQHTTVQAAVDAASAGETIQIVDFVHLEQGIVVDKSLTLAGYSIAGSTLQGAPPGGAATDYVLRIASGVTVSVVNMTIRDGQGGIFNQGTLTVTDGSVADNDGSGIWSTGSLTLVDTDVSGNTSAVPGGGVRAIGPLTIVGGHLSGNQAPSGGALYVAGAVSGALTNVLITANESTDAGAAGGGGAIHVAAGAGLTVEHATLVANSSAVAGRAGVWADAAVVSVTASIVAESNGACTATNGAVITSGGANIESANSCGFNQAGDLPSTDSQLDAANGRPAPTSPAIDAAPTATCPAADVNSLGRPLGAGCDIGAVESNNVLQFCRTPNAPIPDNDPAGVVDVIDLPNLGPIVDVDVTVAISHTWVGDVAVHVTHATTGSSAQIIDRPGVPATPLGCSGDNVDARLDDEAATPIENVCAAATPTIDGVFTPNEALTIFDGENATGPWTLTVSDNQGGDTGALAEWCLIVAAAGGPLTVTRTDDPVPGGCRPGDCSLREAVVDANAIPGHNDIIVAVPGPLSLSRAPFEPDTTALTGDLDIVGSLTIDGLGTAVVDGQGVDRIFDAPAGAVLTLQNLSIHNGAAIEGGAIRVDDGQLFLDQTRVQSSTATTGAGLHLTGAAVLTRSLVSGNVAGLGGGGGLLAAGSEPSVLLIKSTVAGNEAASFGGGLALANGRLVAETSTVAGNASLGVSAVFDGGGGINVYGGFLTGRLDAVTLAGNSATSPGRDGLWLEAGALALHDTILHNPSENCALDGGSAASEGYNLLSDASCRLAATGDQVGLNPLLKPLGDYGGPTPTQPPGPLSPAVDAADPVACGGLMFDQRLIERPQGADCDIGAVELTPGEATFVYLPTLFKR